MPRTRYVLSYVELAVDADTDDNVAVLLLVDPRFSAGATGSEPSLASTRGLSVRRKGEASIVDEESNSPYGDFQTS